MGFYSLLSALENERPLPAPLYWNSADIVECLRRIRERFVQIAEEASYFEEIGNCGAAERKRRLRLTMEACSVLNKLLRAIGQISGKCQSPTASVVAFSQEKVEPMAAVVSCPLNLLGSVDPNDPYGSTASWIAEAISVLIEELRSRPAVSTGQRTPGKRKKPRIIARVDRMLATGMGPNYKAQINISGKPKKPNARKSRVGSTEANLRAREALKSPKFRTLRTLSKAIGYSTRLCVKLPAWRAFQEEKKSSSTSRAARTVPLTPESLANVGNGHTELEQLIAEQVRDAKAENLYPPRPNQVKRFISRK
ncbi:MAG: hypothetical protein ABSG53_17265 [Thermoguttaceae bacterium]|jgi:hypothetical protein